MQIINVFKLSAHLLNSPALYTKRTINRTIAEYAE